MKKLIKTIADYIRFKIDEFSIKRFTSLMPKGIITELYRRIAERDLEIQTRTVFVKKGHIKYTLLIVKDKNLQTVFNLGRHHEKEPVKRSEVALN